MQYLVNQIPVSTSRFIFPFFDAIDKVEIDFASFDFSQIELILTNRWRVAYVVLRLRLIESDMLQTKPIYFPTRKKHSQCKTSIKINIKWILNSSRHNKKEHLHHISHYAAPIVVIQSPEKWEKHLLETDIKYSIYILKTFHIEYFGNWVFASCRHRRLWTRTKQKKMKKTTTTAPNSKQQTIKRCTFIQIFFTPLGRLYRNYDRSSHTFIGRVIHVLYLVAYTTSHIPHSNMNIRIAVAPRSYWKHKFASMVLGTNYSNHFVGCACVGMSEMQMSLPFRWE